VVVVQEVVHLWRVEVPNWSECLSTNGAATLLRHSTFVEAKVVSVVLVALLFQLLHALSCVGTDGWVRNCAGFRAHIGSVSASKLHFGDGLVRIGVLANLQVITNTGLANREHAVGFHYVSELLGIWHVTLFPALQIGMVLHGHFAVRVFDVFRSRLVRKTQDCIVVLLLWDFAVRRIVGLLESFMMVVGWVVVSVTMAVIVVTVSIVRLYVSVFIMTASESSDSRQQVCFPDRSESV